MIVKELIKQLQEADPTGELPVCVGNYDIYLVDCMPAYYDGTLQQLVRDESIIKGYNVVGAKFIANGFKVSIVSESIEDAILENPELPVEYAGYLNDGDKYYKRDVEEWREKSRELEKTINERIKEIKERVIKEKEL